MLAPSQIHTYAIYRSFTLLCHLHLTLSFKCLPKSITNALFVPFICSYKLSPSSYIYLNSVLHFLVFGQLNKMCWTPSLPKHSTHHPLFIFCSNPLNFHIPAASHVIPFLSFLEQYCAYDILPVAQCLNAVLMNPFTAFVKRLSDFAKHYIFLASVDLHPLNEIPVHSAT